MKLCGRWLAVLWVTATLLWPASAAVSRNPSGGSGQWKVPEIGALPVVGDFSPSSEKQIGPGAELDDSPRHDDPMLPGRRPSRVAPICSRLAPSPAADRIHRLNPPLARPSSQGPPLPA